VLQTGNVSDALDLMEFMGVLAAPEGTITYLPNGIARGDLSGYERIDDPGKAMRVGSLFVGTVPPPPPPHHADEPDGDTRGADELDAEALGVDELLDDEPDGDECGADEL
jgi:hypothetical protein